jgi:hypothetical protein
MDAINPVFILKTALISGLVQIGRKLLEAGSATLVNAASDYLKTWLKGGFKLNKTQDEHLDQVIRLALERTGAPTEGEELALWFTRSGLDRLKDKSDYPLNRQLARAVIQSGKPKIIPPEDLVVSLNWPIDQRPQLSTLLHQRHKGLEDLDGWKTLLEYVKAAEEKKLLADILNRLADLENLFVRTRAGQALKVAIVQEGVNPQEAGEIERTYR